MKLGQDALMITVSDTGIGIQPEYYPQLFQPFTQIDLSDTRIYKGTGLGLAMVKTVSDLLRGINYLRTSI
jgi:signal transduction histidine kinase